MEILIWIGALVSVIGLGGILASVVTIARAKRANLDDQQMRDKLRRAMILNIGALFTSVLGLMMVVVGILLR